MTDGGLHPILGEQFTRIGVINRTSFRKMEEAALRGYKKKDLHSNSDFTAKLSNNEELPDVNDTYEVIDHPKSNVIGPQIPKAVAQS